MNKLNLIEGTYCRNWIDMRTFEWDVNASAPNLETDSYLEP